ncbi:MFS transporter [Labrys sedimenti]|uniref:MFS transporter n=1 Tax=Labrys sedimenti TaxID=3106036 RepID=UPI002ACA5D6C|nr:MFS transporter [Labrys sp. ZIDIC5]MDZ5448540.1 MFS transporter [Labrys sp. ZIDIC5]
MAYHNRWLVLAIVSSALFLIVVDLTVLYTALPRLTHDLAATASEKLWILNAYPLVVAGLLPGCGTLGDRVGSKRLFMAGLIAFGAASLLAAFAPSSMVLIAARALLAVGAAMMMPATLAIIRVTFTSEKERAFAIGVWAAVASSGAAFGPVLGGLLLEFFWWGSVFLINVPVVVVAWLAAWLVLENRPGRATHPWDLVGSLQIMVGLIATAYAIKELGKRSPSWEAALAAGLLGALAFFLFRRRQRRSEMPLIDFGLFRNPEFAAGVIVATVSSAALIGVELVFSQHLQLVRNLSPLQAGLLLLPIPLASIVAGPLAGLALPRLGARHVLWTSLALAGGGLAVFLLTHDGTAALWLTALSAMGFGVGASMSAASSAIMVNAPEERAGMAASIEEVSYELGGALGVAVMGTIMSAIYTAMLVLPSDLPVAGTVRDSLDEALLAAEGLPSPLGDMLARLARSAFERAFLGVIAVCSLLFLLTALVVGLMGRRQDRLGDRQPIG